MHFKMYCCTIAIRVCGVTRGEVKKTCVMTLECKYERSKLAHFIILASLWLIVDVSTWASVGGQERTSAKKSAINLSSKCHNLCICIRHQDLRTSSWHLCNDATVCVCVSFWCHHSLLQMSMHIKNL